ncbi:MAG: Fic/DOC family N-terminal domain-containing protein [Gordonia amarae]
MTPWDPREPYNALPQPPQIDVLETPRVLKATIEARAALARLDQAAASIPDPTILINTIPLIEAQASSEIENIVTTTDTLFRFLDDDESADPATREALRYRTALRVGYDAVRRRGLTVATATTICTTIKGREMRVRDLPGTHLAHPITGQVTYTPPDGKEIIQEKLADWERFIHTDNGLDPLVRMAVAHYQFEAIHPYADGNGRTGRIINILMLCHLGVLGSPILYLSRYIIATKDDYYRHLLAVTGESAWEDWIVYMLHGVDQTSRSVLSKITAITELTDDFAHRARAVTSGGGDRELLRVLFEQPYCRIATVVSRTGVSRPTATKRLEALVAAGMLSDIKVGRDRLFINRELLRVLTRSESDLGSPLDASTWSRDTVRQGP